MAKIGIDLDDLTSKLGFEAVIHAYPEFREFYADFTCSRNKIVGSRENRDDRNGIYETLTAVDLPNLVERYEKLMAMRPLAKQTSLRLKLGSVWGVIAGLALLAGCLFAGLSVNWDIVLGASQAENSKTKKT